MFFICIGDSRSNVFSFQSYQYISPTQNLRYEVPTVASEDTSFPAPSKPVVSIAFYCTHITWERRASASKEKN